MDNSLKFPSNRMHMNFTITYNNFKLITKDVDCGYEIKSASVWVVRDGGEGDQSWAAMMHAPDGGWLCGMLGYEQS